MFAIADASDTITVYWPVAVTGDCVLAAVPLTVYVVVTAGVTVIDGPLCPGIGPAAVLHWKIDGDVLHEAVNVTGVLRGTGFGRDAEIVHDGCRTTTVADAAGELPPLLPATTVYVALPGTCGACASVAVACVTCAPPGSVNV
jgi:hypothetical protein